MLQRSDEVKKLLAERGFFADLSRGYSLPWNVSSRVGLRIEPERHILIKIFAVIVTDNVGSGHLFLFAIVKTLSCVFYVCASRLF